RRHERERARERERERRRQTRDGRWDDVAPAGAGTEGDWHMIRRGLKSTYYTCAGGLMRANGFLYRRFRAPDGGNGHVVKVHLGPGQKNYIPGWINVDANVLTAKIDVWADLRN